MSDRNRMPQSVRAGEARRRVLLITFICIAACAIAAMGIARHLQVSFPLAMLGAMIASYGLLSVVVLLLRRRLAARVNSLPPAVQEAWRSIDAVVRYESAPAPADGRTSARTAVWVGVILINGPLIPLMVGPLFIVQWLLGLLPGAAPIANIAALALGFALAWSWWSAGVTLWRGWATRRGVDPGELQYRGESASLLWPRGHVFEKTELGNVLRRLRQGR